MLVRRSVKFALVAVTLSLIGGCQYVGPIAIDQGRDRYNGIIQSTSKEQTFSNIIRVRNHEPTSFMDVSEVDATTTLSGNVSGAISGIGAKATKSTTAGTLAGQVGAVSGGAVYTEQPLIRYTPLLGQALVAQLVTPVSADVLGDLFDSSWRICPLLDLAASNLTPNINEFYAVLNIICELSREEALAFAATKSDLTKAQSETKSAQIGTLEVTTKPSSGGGNNDALTIYFNPFSRQHSTRGDRFSWRELQLWIRLLWLYSGTQPTFTPKDPAWCASIGLSSRNENELRNWDLHIRLSLYIRNNLPRLDPAEVAKCLPTSIELRNKPVMPAKVRSEGLTSGAPLLKTYSAIGILKNATEMPGPRIEFVSHDQYREIINYNWNKDADNLNWLVSYTLLPGSEDLADDPSNPNPKRTNIDKEITNYLETESNIFVYDPKKAKTALPFDDYVLINRRLASLRRYVLIIMDDHAPGNAYVSHFDHGTWYYIDAADQISQKNFDLISLFLTMMAIPAALPPISPTISVGGSGG